MTNKFKPTCNCAVVKITPKCIPVNIGDSYEFDIFVYETPAQASAFNLQDSTLTFTGVDDPASPSVTMTKFSGDGIVIISIPLGHARVVLTPEDTSILGPLGGSLFYDIKLLTPDDTTFTVASGSFLLTPDVG